MATKRAAPSRIAVVDQVLGQDKALEGEKKQNVTSAKASLNLRIKGASSKARQEEQDVKVKIERLPWDDAAGPQESSTERKVLPSRTRAKATTLPTTRERRLATTATSLPQTLKVSNEFTKVLISW